MSLAEIISVLGIVVFIGIAIWEISRTEDTGPDRDRVEDPATELARLERDLADHGSFGRTFADRELI